MKKQLVFGILFLLSMVGTAQLEKSNDSLVYQFTDQVSLPASPVKDQYRTGTCWAFSGLSFLESELLRMGNGGYNLSEMWLVKKDYHARAIDYVRWQGEKSFSGGAESNNVMERIADSGIVPEEVFSGLNYGTTQHVHGEMDAVVENKNRQLSTAWLHGFDGILDAYLGKDVENFTYKGKSYTPASFRDELGIKADDYVEITSFTHHPFYTRFVMEVPDNWALGSDYNVPMQEMLQTVYYSLDHGYTVLWGTDTSEKGFSFKNGVAIIPQDDLAEMNNTERLKWEKLSEKDRKKQMYEFDKIVPEKTITQEMRQKAFDDYQTTDDHGLHIIGYAVDQNGKKYFKVKNSWNTDNPYHGYFYASEAYFLYKTLSIMVHKDAVPKEIAKKLGI